MLINVLKYVEILKIYFHFIDLSFVHICSNDKSTKCKSIVNIHISYICNTTSQEWYQGSLLEKSSVPDAEGKRPIMFEESVGGRKERKGRLSNRSRVIYILGHQPVTIIYIMGHLLATITRGNRKGETIED